MAYGLAGVGHAGCGDIAAMKEQEEEEKGVGGKPDVCFC